MTFPKMTAFRKGAEDFKKHPSREGKEIKPCAETFITLVSGISPSQAVASGFSDKGLYQEVMKRAKHGSFKS